MYNLFLGLTGECNYHCRPCHHFISDSTKYVNKINIEPLSRFFSKFGFPCAAYIAGGGEPLLSDVYEPIADLLTRNKTTVITITNGSKLSKLSNDFLLKHNFIVSLPSVNETLYYDYTGCKSHDALDTIKQNITRLNRNTIVQVTLVRQNTFDENIKELFGFCDEYGIEFISFQIASHSMNGDAECYLSDSSNDYLHHIKNISNNYNVNLLGYSERTPDYYRLFKAGNSFNANSIVIQEDGNFFCCCSPDAKQIGSIDDEYHYNTISELKSKLSVCRRCGIL